MTKEEIKEITDLVINECSLSTKAVLTSSEAAKYMGVSMSYLYKLTSEQKVPHYKPGGKMCYFNRAELEQWLQSNRVATGAEIAQKAQSFCQKGGGL